MKVIRFSAMSVSPPRGSKIVPSCSQYIAFMLKSRLFASSVRDFENFTLAFRPSVSISSRKVVIS